MDSLGTKRSKSESDHDDEHFTLQAWIDDVALTPNAGGILTTAGKVLEAVHPEETLNNAHVDCPGEKYLRLDCSDMEGRGKDKIAAPIPNAAGFPTTSRKATTLSGLPLRKDAAVAKEYQQDGDHDIYPDWDGVSGLDIQDNLESQSAGDTGFKRTLEGVSGREHDDNPANGSKYRSIAEGNTGKCKDKDKDGDRETILPPEHVQDEGKRVGEREEYGQEYSKDEQADGPKEDEPGENSADSNDSDDSDDSNDSTEYGPDGEEVGKTRPANGSTKTATRTVVSSSHIVTFNKVLAPKAVNPDPLYSGIIKDNGNDGLAYVSKSHPGEHLANNVATEQPLTSPCSLLDVGKSFASSPTMPSSTREGPAGVPLMIIRARKYVSGLVHPKQTVGEPEFNRTGVAIPKNPSDKMSISKTASLTLSMTVRAARGVAAPKAALKKRSKIPQIDRPWSVQTFKAKANFAMLLDLVESFGEDRKSWENVNDKAILGQYLHHRQVEFEKADTAKRKQLAKIKAKERLQIKGTK
ncbi:uncharacterized protein BDR25DRAFT_352048 [Lindgomyces ingoldianus]|uniref:Uncharacterized protein n=1 Tax=Lindgomyces ingoldianus TaxID=673940 RepID=A0ACB6R2K3_9PLEO|nr:uncharacterized protein BDR25DRAFT_352048 [Lindgomyces ingoldianus]KAF2473554.1 hypothetical protein BDR25DRAFT_352048 [Lindgomyces ingoldianus]